MPVPLLVAFHGSGSTAAAMRAEAGLDRVAAREGFLVAYPNAPAGNWAEDCDCTIADRLGVNDTGFVRALVEDVAAHYPVDRARVAAVGLSQGGVFVHRLGCQMADLVHAIASVAAPMAVPLASRCTPVAPVSVLVLQGTLDASFPYEGGGVGARATLGARETARVWRAVNGCSEVPEPAATPDRVADGTSVLAETWTRCASGARVALYTVEGGRHAWSPSADLVTAEVVTAFLLGRRP
jgi:polyhydroxybutyrate depolymerase